MLATLAFRSDLPHGWFVLRFHNFRLRHFKQRLHGPREVPQGRRAFVARLGLHARIVSRFPTLWQKLLPSAFAIQN